MGLKKYSYVNPNFWKGKKVLITGHTGFKGSWLVIWLKLMGANLTGYSLLPITKFSLFEVAKVKRGIKSVIGDIRDTKAVLKLIKKTKPEIVLHLAAQPLVRYSYKKPIDTYETNVMGTINLLEACRKVKSVKVFLNITSDKCYQNKKLKNKKYRETDPMGGDDPYSSSKACSELVTKAYRASFFKNNGIGLATARAGNIIGGGDWSMDRLVPDIFRSMKNRKNILIRNPKSVRPWQHVLEALSGYIILVQKLYHNKKNYSDGWNFGPNYKDTKNVKWIVDYMIKKSGSKINWTHDKKNQVAEENYLNLSNSKTKSILGWKTIWTLEKALVKTLEWNNFWLQKQNMNKICERQINSYIRDSKNNKKN